MPAALSSASPIPGAAMSKSKRPTDRGRHRGLRAIERSALVALCDAMLPPGGAVAEGALDLGIPAEIEGWISSFSPASRRSVRAMLFGFDLTPLLSRRIRPFHRLSAADRAAWTDGSAHCRLRPRREAFSGLETLVQIAYASHP